MGKTKGFEVVVSGCGSEGPLSRLEAREIATNIRGILNDEYKVNVVSLLPKQKPKSEKSTKSPKVEAVGKSYDDVFRSVCGVKQWKK